MLRLIESTCDIYSGRKHTKENIASTLSVAEEALSSLTFIAHDFEVPKEEKESYSNEEGFEIVKVLDCLTSTLSDCAKLLQQDKDALNRNLCGELYKTSAGIEKLGNVADSLDEVEKVLNLLHSIVKSNGKISHSETRGQDTAEKERELTKKLSKSTEQIQAIYELQNTAAYIIRYLCVKAQLPLVAS